MTSPQTDATEQRDQDERQAGGLGGTEEPTGNLLCRKGHAVTVVIESVPRHLKLSRSDLRIIVITVRATHILARLPIPVDIIEVTVAATSGRVDEFV